METVYNLLTKIRYPMPTIALVNGHAFAGGLMLAMYHDYRIFNPSRGFLCLNELDFGYPLKPPMASIFREKIPYPAVYRTMVLEAKRFAGKEALEYGIVDGLGGIEEALALVKERNLTEKGKSGVYGTLKSEMYRESLGFLEGHTQEEKRYTGMIKDDEQRKIDGQARVKEWERNSRNVRGNL
jgi:Delta3-Delta2-enoyl-CoA isomerase